MLQFQSPLCVNLHVWLAILWVQLFYHLCSIFIVLAGDIDFVFIPWGCVFSTLNASLDNLFGLLKFSLWYFYFSHLGIVGSIPPLGKVFDTYLHLRLEWIIVRTMYKLPLIHYWISRNTYFSSEKKLQNLSKWFYYIYLDL